MKYHAALLTLLSGSLLSFAVLATAADYHTFTSADGRSISARFLRADGDTIHIERNDGTRFALARGSLDSVTQGALLFMEDETRRH